MENWKGCKLNKCPYGKEYGDCSNCDNLITEELPMTNREYLQKLDNNHFLKATSAFYFRYPLWTGKDYKGNNIPSNELLSEWLNKPYDPESDFWKYVNMES